MNAIAQMIKETRILTQERHDTVQEEVEEEFPNANEERLEMAVEQRMKQYNVDMFTELFKNNIRFFMDLLHTDLMQRVIEEKERLLNQEQDDDELFSLDDEDLLIDAIDLSREYIEDLFTP